MDKINHTHCCYCRRKLDDNNEKLKSTKEHFIPTSKGGLSGLNLLQCCKECNQWKSDKMPEHWLNQIEYFQKKRILYGSYALIDYRQIIGSVRHWIKYFNKKEISIYKY